MAHKYNLYYTMIVEKEELDRRGRQIVLYLQFCTDNLSASAIFYLLKIQNLTPGIVFSLEVSLIAPAIAKAALY